MNFSQLFSFASSSSGAAKRVLGIDIGSSAIKVVELENRDDVLTLTTYGEIQLGPYDAKDVGQAVTLPVEKEQEALVDVLRESSVKARQAVLAMPLAASFVTILSLQAKADEDLTPRIRVEARKYIPTQISEVTLDWAEVVGSTAGGNERDILVAAIQNDSLKRFADLTTFVGFAKPPTEIECFSAIRALTTEGEEHVAIIDVGAVATKLYIVRTGLLQRMHRVRSGGALATRRIAEVLAISFAEAEELKRTVDTANPRYADCLKAHESIYESALGEFKQVLDVYELAHNVSIPRVFLAGGGAQFIPLFDQVARVLGKDVQLARPFSKVAYPAFMEDLLTTVGPGFVVALGAALRSFD